jgi:hypothetical protein
MPDNSTYYFVKKQTTAPSSEDEHNTFLPGEVISDWELSKHVKEQLKKGILWYTETYEPLTSKEAKNYRIKATTMEGKRTAPNGQIVEPPWEDYVGLHPKEIIERMSEMKFDEVESVRQYERGGMNRNNIIDYVAPSEREPFHGFEDMGVKEVLDKMDLLDEQAIQDIITFEMYHQKRPAIIEFEPEDNNDSQLVLPNGDLDNQE